MQQLQDGAILRKEPHVSHMDTETVNREELLKVQREIEDKIKNAEMEISQKEEELKRSEDSLRTLRSRSRIQDSQKQTRQKVYCGKGVIFPQPWTSTPEENVRQKLLPSEAESRPYDHHDYQVSMDSPQDTSQHDDQYETTRLYSRSTLYPETNANHLARSYPELESSQQARQHSHADAGEESLLHRLADLLADKRDNGLPNMEPETFTGDLLKFSMWLNSFEALIESKTELPSERLFFLAKYTAGDARDCIQGYLTLFTEEAYAQAKYQLKTRYGDKVKVARAYRRKLEDWQSIRPNDGEALQKFADFLWQCHAAMSTISYLGSLDSMEENKKLIRKLPYYIVDWWSQIVDKQLYAVQFDQVGRYPNSPSFVHLYLRKHALPVVPLILDQLPALKIDPTEGQGCSLHKEIVQLRLQTQMTGQASQSPNAHFVRAVTTFLAAVTSCTKILTQKNPSLVRMVCALVV